MPQPPRASTPTEVLAGLVERVTFHNDENGFCVLRVKARGQRDLITVLGHAAVITAGQFVATLRFETINLPSRTNLRRSPLKAYDFASGEINML
jgi:exodeoxyribonuclease V alpha subunit